MQMVPTHLDDHVVGLVDVELHLGAGVGVRQAQLRARHVLVLEALQQRSAGCAVHQLHSPCERAGVPAGTQLAHGPAEQLLAVRLACTHPCDLQTLMKVARCWRTPRSSSPTYSLHSHGTPVSSCTSSNATQRDSQEQAAAKDSWLC